ERAAESGSTEPGPSPKPPIERPPEFAPTRVAANEGRDAERASRAPSSGAQLVANGGRVPGESDVYDREITRLRTVLRQRRSDLDPRTVQTIEKSLAVIDTAITQARSALAADPASRFLNDQLTHALDKKVELLRTAALLPARS
ncbi:MAG TPA: hypothetical protein VHM30_07600, partial [Gemmatimonadaceae bacterium]|nr:hypothetical protein [Gemmatimonadaceae bacterium]